MTGRTSRSWRRALVVAALVLPLAGRAAPAQAAPPPTVQATPATGLVDFQPVLLTGSGFEPNALLEWFECRGGAVTEADCDGYNADFIDVDSGGNVSAMVYVDARIFLPDGTAVDCRTDPAGCELGVGFMVDAGDWPEVALDFDPAAPLRPEVAGSVTPSTDLVDGEVVQVAGTDLSFREEGFAFLCRAGTEPVGERCDLDAMAREVPAADGSLAASLTVRAPFDPPLGDPVDCRSAGTTCVVEIGWGFAPPPDRRAIVAVSFEPLATTTTTAATTTSTPSQESPTAPPATPVDATASFTG